MAKINVLTNISTESPSWVLPERHAEAIAAVDSQVRLTVARSRDEFREALPETEVIFGRPPVGDDIVVEAPGRQQCAQVALQQRALVVGDALARTQFGQRHQGRADDREQA